MKIEIRAEGVELSKRLASHIERRARFALTRFRERLGRVHVLIADTNGPRGGVDIHCKVRAEVSGVGQLVIRELHHDPFAAVSKATERISHAVARRVKRGSARRRGRLSKLTRFRHLDGRGTELAPDSA